MIREAHRKDVPEILLLMLEDIRDREWEADSGYPLDEYSIQTIIHYHIRDSNGVALVSQDDAGIKGYFLGCVMPYLLDIRVMAAHEKMSGGENVDKMWEFFKEWGRSKNAVTCVRGCYDRSDDSRFRRIY